MNLVARRKWIASAACLSAVAFVAAAHAQPLPTRVTIDILTVSNGSNDPIAAERIAQWSNELQKRLRFLAVDPSLGLVRARQIVVTHRPQSGPMSQAAVELTWQQRRNIQIVLAEGIRVGNSVTAEGQIYVGSLRGQQLASPLIKIRQPISAQTYQKASDYIFMTALYALSVDAGSRKPVACELLRRARLLGVNITRSVDDANIKQSITKRLTDLGCKIG